MWGLVVTPWGNLFLVVLVFRILTSRALAGEKSQASALLLPEATETVIPAWTMLLTARSMDRDEPPPRDMEATAGILALAVTQSIPAIQTIKTIYVLLIFVYFIILHTGKTHWQTCPEISTKG